MLLSTLVLAGNAVAHGVSAVSAANEATDQMIGTLKQSENPSINRVGRVLEGVKSGFMIGYVAPSIVGAVGVALTTGSLMSAIATATQTLANPIAGVCAAVGAIYFGWSALTQDEKDKIIGEVSGFLNVGAELIKGVVAFSVKSMKEILSSDNIQELKAMVRDAAEVAGRHLSDVTKSALDKIAEISNSITTTASGAAAVVTSTAGGVSKTAAGYLSFRRKKD